jgi:exo-1,4-beta-D-glucosaminidase
MHRTPFWLSLLLVACSARPPVGTLTAPPSRAPAVRGAMSTTTELKRGWRIQSSARATQSGEEVSQVRFSTAGWFDARVPSTVLANLQDDGVYRNLYDGDNLAAVPTARFAVPWWYRTEFDLAAAPATTHTFLHLEGVNDRAEIWLNGRRVATSDQIVGAFRAFDLDVTSLVHDGANAVAIRVDPVDPANDLTITWIDWNPLAPDNGMGLWQPVSIRRSGPVSLRDPYVATDLPLPRTDSADLTVSATLRNDGDTSVTATVSGTIGDVAFSKEVSIAANGVQEVSFDPAFFAQLHLQDPQVWWPAQLGKQPLYELTLSVAVGGIESDTASTTFGIREVSSELMGSGARRWLVNGKPILIRGAGWASDLLLRPVPTRVEQQLTYAREIGLNAIRLEGKLETDHFYDVADRLGILVLPGWMCCDRWQESDSWTPEEHAIGQASATTQALRMRDHPSVIAFLIGSDTNPAPDVAREFVNALDVAEWPDPILASASGDWTSPLEPTGLKMTGPYDWVPPGYWYAPQADGGATGFNTETSAGASIPELETVRRMLTPAERRTLWQRPSRPQAHSGTGDSVFNNFRIFGTAMDERMGRATSLADFVQKAQVMQYENERAMFEAFGREKYATSTGVIQWMFDSAWPSLHWNLFDYYLEPNGSTFGAQKANESVHVQYSYDDASVVVVNETPTAIQGLTTRTRVYALDGTLLYDHSAAVSVHADGVSTVQTVPDPRGLTSTYFVRLALRDSDGTLVSTNTYWLSTAPDTLSWNRSRWFFTPTRTFADFTALSSLPTARPDVTECSRTDDGVQRFLRTTVSNGEASVAFFLRLRLTDGSGADITPVAWSDNDLTLMPGERRTVTARFEGSKDTHVIVSGWNVPTSTIDAVPAC